MDSGLITSQAIMPDQLLSLIQSGVGILCDSAQAITPESLQNSFAAILTNIQQSSNYELSTEQPSESDDVQTIESIIASLTAGIIVPPAETPVAGNGQIAEVMTQTAQAETPTVLTGTIAESGVLLEGSLVPSETVADQVKLEASAIVIEEAAFIDPENMTGKDNKISEHKESILDTQVKLSLKDHQLLSNTASQIVRKPQTISQSKHSKENNLTADKTFAKMTNSLQADNPANLFQDRREGMSAHRPPEDTREEKSPTTNPAPEQAEKAQVTSQDDVAQKSTEPAVSVKSVEESTIGLKHFEQALSKATDAQGLAKPASPATPNTPHAVNPAELLNGVKLTLKQGGSQLLMQLKPEVLGRALVSMKHLEGKLSLEFLVEHESARQTIQSEASHLKETLVSVGFTEVVIDVKTMPPTPFQTDVESGESQLHQEQSRNGDGNERQAQEEQERLSRKPLMLGYNTFELIA